MPRLSIASLITASVLSGAAAFATARPAAAGLAAVLPCTVGPWAGKKAQSRQDALYPYVTNSTGRTIPPGSLISVTVSFNGTQRRDDIQVPADTTIPAGLAYPGPAMVLGYVPGAVCTAGLVGPSGPTYGNPSIPPHTVTHPKPVLQ